MKNKKLLWLLIGLACIAVCFVLLLTMCSDSGSQNEPTEPSDTVTEPDNDPTEGESGTKPEATEPEATEPEPTELETTEPEATEPEETQPSGSSSAPNVNTGTGGGYTPGTDTTEPTEPTEPEIEVPAAGSENNAYYEQVANTTGTFTTVNIPAGETVYYRLKTPGTFLRVEDAEVSILYDGNTYTPEDGVAELTLPADDSKAISLQFTNNGSEDKAFSVNIRDALGSQDNPIVLESIAVIETSLEEGNSDGVYYSWIADSDGVLNIGFGSVECADDVADAVITVNGETVSLSEENGFAQIPVSLGDTVSIQVLVHENADGIYPAAQIQVGGYIALIVELEVNQVPAEVESVTVPGYQSVIYRITGISGKTLKIMDPDFYVLYNEALYSPDENGVITVKIPAGTSNEPVELEMINAAAEAKAVQMSIGYSIGHQNNPHILTELGELATQTVADQGGYYYSYTAPSAGMVTFQVWEYPEAEGAKTDIVILNKNTNVSGSLWSTDENGDPVQEYTVSVPVNAGDELSIHVSVVDASNKNLDAALIVLGDLYGSEDMPIPVQYPGFTAQVPAGTTLYYQGYNMNEMVFFMGGQDVAVSHNGTDYTPVGGEITFNVVAQGRNPAMFAISNTGTDDAAYDVSFTYPLGHTENPDVLTLGTNTATQTAGRSDYCYTFTAPRAGTLTVSFDAAAQWLYAVDNLTQGIYGDTQWSDSDPLVTETTVAVAAGDEIRIRVNTYDSANMFENPAGTVTFTAKYVTGPTSISVLTLPTNTTLLPGEYAVYSGVFYDHVLSISNARDLVVNFNGTDHVADAQGEISVEFPASGSSETDLQFTVYNAGTAQIIRSMSFSSKEKGSKENPDVLPYGTVTLTQPEDNSEDYYYTYTATARGTLVITFDANADWIYQLTNTTRNQTSGVQLSAMGRYTYSIAVRPGDVIELMVNTFDPMTGMSPEGTVEFTVTFR